MIGNFQNPWREVNFRKNNLPIVRRFSGGGTVYHDLGNLNFSFIRKDSQTHRCQNLTLLKDVLCAKNIPIHINERHDLIATQNDKQFKVSGSALKTLKSNSLHHGTLLVRANIAQLRGLLNPTYKNIETKAVASVKSKVCNICEFGKRYSTQNILNYLIEDIKSKYSAQLISFDELNDLYPKAVDLSEKYLDKTWTWNKTPVFTLKLKNATQLYELTFDKGKLRSIQSSSDSIFENTPPLDLFDEHHEIIEYLKSIGPVWLAEEFTS